MIYQKTSNFAKISWFFSKSADHRYQVWHKISVGVLDRVSMVPFLGLKSLISGLSKFSTSSLTLPRHRGPTPMWSTFLEPPDPYLSFEISFATSRTLLYFDLIWTLAYWLDSSDQWEPRIVMVSAGWHPDPHHTSNIFQMRYDFLFLGCFIF